MDFTDARIYEPQYQYQCYRLWQCEQAAKRRSSHTQFNLYQCRSQERLAEHSHWKMEVVRGLDATKDMVERRLSQACGCENCHSGKGRSNSTDSSVGSLASEPVSPTDSFCSSRNQRNSISRRAAENMPGNTISSPTTSMSHSEAVVSSPPTTRHHERRKRSVPEL